MDIINDQPLTKKQRRLLRRQQQKEDNLLLTRRKKIKKTVFILLPIVLLAGGVIFSLLNYSPSKPEETQGTPKIEIVEKEYDAGTISMADKVVKHTFEIKNTGYGDLRIDSIWTSCHCTTAKLKVGDKTSLEFGMDRHSTSQKIAPGQTGFLEVTFDPAFHGPQGTGSVVRAVYLSTDDPQNKKVEVRLVANVIQ